MGERATTPKSAPHERLSREVWLAQALEVLSREGESKLRIDRICEALGVTKGSFYWHFKNRMDFLQAIIGHWAQVFNRRVPETAKERGGTAMDQLRSVFTIVTEGDLGKYDAAFDSWAAHEPRIAERVREVYQWRYDYVGSLFRGLGFRGIELETRTTAFLSFLKVETRVTGKPRPRRTARRMEAELAFFTRDCNPL